MAYNILVQGFCPLKLINSGNELVEATLSSEDEDEAVDFLLAEIGSHERGGYIFSARN